MRGSRSMRLVETALRCYPQRWRSRHGDEAAEIATLLIRDGTPAWSVAWSYLLGAARTRLVIEPRRRVGAAVCALLLAVGSLGIPLALLSSSAPANAASVTHSRATHPRPADLRHGDTRHGDTRHGDTRHGDTRHGDTRHGDLRPDGQRYSEGSGVPDGCDRLDHC
jgi:hypothetical protein